MGWFFSGPSWRESLRTAERALLDSEPWASVPASSTSSTHSTVKSTPSTVNPASDAPSRKSSASYSISDVAITMPSGTEQSIHTITARAPPPADAAAAAPAHDGLPLVLLHGYGQGAASWWRNLIGLVEGRAGADVHAVDWMGVGLSSRPDWDEKNDHDPAKAEAWFVNSMEAWREAKGIEKMHLVGHSMGGMIAVAYAEQYPHRLESLLLASPAGVSAPPDTSLREQISDMPWGLRKSVFSFTIRQWENGQTAQGIVQRWSMLGRRIINGYVSRRFSETVPNKPLFADYMYHHWQGDGNPSGERFMNAMLMPGAYAKYPLEGRIPRLDANLPVSFCYGDRDWMDIDAGIEVANVANNQEERKHRMQVWELPECGHQLMVDEPDHFNQCVLNACRPRTGPPPSRTMTILKTRDRSASASKPRWQERK